MKRYAFLLLVLIQITVRAQNNRINTDHTIAWTSLMSNIKVKGNWSIQIEYHNRRVQLYKDGQQSLVRLGLNYKINSQSLIRIGYAWAENFPYGEYPTNSFGKTVTEHRLYESLLYSQQIDKVSISHRVMLEQRFIGKFNAATSLTEDSYTYANRIRYMIRCQIPLKGRQLKNKTPYISCYNELFIGFGKNVNNVFDQNRCAVLCGYRWNTTTSLEIGFINQQLQLNRTINNWAIFQNNSGIITNLNFNL